MQGRLCEEGAQVWSIAAPADNGGDDASLFFLAWLIDPPPPPQPRAQACMPLVHAAYADASQELQAPVKNVTANSGAFRLRRHTLPILFQIVGDELKIMLNIKSGRRKRPSKPNPAPPRSPPLPSFAIVKAVAADSPHKTCGRGFASQHLWPRIRLTTLVQHRLTTLFQHATPTSFTSSSASSLSPRS